ncbi:DNA methyltransferase 1-associated protein 1 [Amyelois transitella]|uniref:DNA methyltransferase 1-associated protein 1 n=1 Tax=Amyelois transitella TaxID=680683 RepID=UPI00067D04DB|nr:DNA methyltransferase 1-associated protein 1 [Amyelois transitella]XP_060803886.1 DNA methyltransferase 1-associated protein 1 [Amyelois transitella]
MADILDILDIEMPGASEVSRDSIIHGDKAKKKYVTAKAVKRPEGMHREVFALLYNDSNKELPPMLPTDTGKAYKQTKAKLGMRKVRKWVWAPFTNPARTDNAVFYHWKRAADEAKEYPFAQFNKQVSVPSYSESEYNQYLKSEDWSQAETDHLMDLCQRFDLRFIVIHDRWDRAAFRDRSVEDLKERYYNICAILSKVKTNPWSNTSTMVNGEKRVYHYDAEHERKRKEQLRRLFERTQEQIDEEQMLLAELKKIEARKRERERKTQDLQKLISRADSGNVTANNHVANNNEAAGTLANTPNAARRHDKKLQKKKLTTQQRPVRAVEAVTVEWSGIKFPEARGAGVSLRSQRMKLPPGVGRKAKAIEQELRLLNIDVSPTPTEAICKHFNDLRSDLALVLDLKSALVSCEFELQALRHQYEAVNPGKTLTIPASICSSTDNEAKPMSEIIDVVGSPSAHNSTI